MTTAITSLLEIQWIVCNLRWKEKYNVPFPRPFRDEKGNMTPECVAWHLGNAADATRQKAMSFEDQFDTMGTLILLETGEMLLIGSGGLPDGTRPVDSMVVVAYARVFNVEGVTT